MRSNRHFDKKGIYLAAFLFPIFCLTVSLAICGVYPFGDRSALVIDGIQQNLGLFGEMLNKVHAGSSLFYSQHALGYDFFILYAYYLSSPFNLLALLLSRFLFVNESITIIVFLKIGLSGVAMTWYLRKRSVCAYSAPIALGVGCFYALSNFIIGYYSNLMWLDCILLLPILAYAIERLVRDGRWKLYCVTLFACIYTNYYLAFLTCIFAALYFVVRLVSESRVRPVGRGQDAADLPNGAAADPSSRTAVCFPSHAAACPPSRAAADFPIRTAEASIAEGDEKAKKRRLLHGCPRWLRAGLLFAFSSLLAAGMSAVILLPSIHALGQTRAADELGGIFSAETYGEISDQLTGHFFEAEPINVSTDQGAVNFYCGSAILFGFLLYLMNRRIKGRERAAYAVLILLYFLGSHFRTLNLLLHGLHKPVGLPNRFAFLYIFLLLSVCARALEDVRRYRKKHLLLAALFTLALYAAAAWKSDKLFTSWATLAVVLLLFMLTLLYKSRGRLRLRRKAYYMAVLVLLFVEAAAHTVYAVYINGTSNRDLYVVRRDEIAEMTAQMDDTDWHRTVIVHPAIRNEEVLCGLNGMSLFSSTLPDETLDLLENIGCESYNNRFQSTGASELIHMLFGVRYLVYEQDRDLQNSYQMMAQVGSLQLYKNRHALSLGYMVDEGITAWNTDSDNPMAVQNDWLVTACGMPALYHMSKTEAQIQAEKSATYRIAILGGLHAYLYLPGEEPDLVTVNGQKYEARDCTNNFIDLGYFDEDRAVTVKADRAIYTGILGVYDETRLDGIYNHLSQRQLTLTDSEDGDLRGHIDAGEGGILLLAETYHEGLSAQVDGVSAPLLNINGMPALRLTAGTHEVKLTYETPYFRLGLLVSAASCIVFLVIILGESRKRRR